MKLKDILDGGYKIEQGQVFTDKDCPPFKTPKQIAEDDVNEVTYREFKNDESMTSRQKVGTAIKQMNGLLYQMEQLIRQSSKLKNEMGMDPSEYWKSTHSKLERVTRRVVKVAKHLKELKKEQNDHLSEGVKAGISTIGGFNVAMKIDGVRPNDLRKIRDWQKTAKKGYVNAKGKATVASFKKWLKLYQPKEYYAKWRKDSPTWKDDSFEVFYTE